MPSPPALAAPCGGDQTVCNYINGILVLTSQIRKPEAKKSLNFRSLKVHEY
jgi:hypothetical protein